MRYLKVVGGFVVLVMLVAAFLKIEGFLNFGSGEVDHSRNTSEKSNHTVSAVFVGSKKCAECHKHEYELWVGSHHDLAMQDANERTVLGDFENKEFDYFGLKSEFYRSGDKFMVRTDGHDGKLRDYEIKYTFGVYPLQQYLIEFPDGRLQALGIAWDSRPGEEGGQRWFHLYPDGKIKYKDTIHWTGIDQNWNHMCAECHSTNLRKNYDLKSDTFKTTWSEINVSCEACHGPGSEHIKWAEHKNGDAFPNLGLLVSFDERKGVSWTIDRETGNAVRSRAPSNDREIAICARCHSRRSAISDDYAYGKSLLDTHIPALLDEGVYYPDGQIEAEDYEWGSFVQSKMYHKGVTCSNCHNPHSLELRKPGNAVCAQCHEPSKYDSASHHHHETGSAGSGCAGCHMAVTTYMIIDDRHDHSMRVPRPDLTFKIGTPNACNKCHTDRTSEWAASEVKSWGVENNNVFQNYGVRLYEARKGTPGAEGLLVELADDDRAPSIARATALNELSGYLSPSSIGAVRKGLGSDDPLIRGAALDALQLAPPDIKTKLAIGLLNDPVLAVRVKAVTVLASSPRENMTTEQRKALDDAVNEYVKVQMTNADRPEAHVNIGLIYAELGQFTEAESSYETAIKLAPSFVPAYVNLADLYRMEGKDGEAESILRKALEISPENADVYHSLGLALVRQNRIPEAMNALEESVKLSPDNTRYSYVYAVALNDTGKKSESILVLEEAHKRRPADREVLYALINFNRENGDLPSAVKYAEKLLQLSQRSPDALRLLDELKQAMNQ